MIGRVAHAGRRAACVVGLLALVGGACAQSPTDSLLRLQVELSAETQLLQAEQEGWITRETVDRLKRDGHTVDEIAARVGLFKLAETDFNERYPNTPHKCRFDKQAKVPKYVCSAL